MESHFTSMGPDVTKRDKRKQQARLGHLTGRKTDPSNLAERTKHINNAQDIYSAQTLAVFRVNTSFS